MRGWGSLPRWKALGFTRGVCATLSWRKWKPGHRAQTAGPASCVEQTYIFLGSTRAIRSPGLMSFLQSFGLRIQSPTQGTDSTTGSQGNTSPKASAASSCWIFSASCVPAHPLVAPILSGCLHPRILLCPSWNGLGSIPCPPQAGGDFGNGGGGCGHTCQLRAESTSVQGGCCFSPSSPCGSGCLSIPIRSICPAGL